MYSILLGVLAMSATFSQAAPAPTQNPSLALDSTSKLGFANFTQLVSHDDPSLGTFQQQYVYSLDFWSGPGAPIIFGTPGEADLIPAIPAGTGANITDLQLARASYFTSNATTMVLAQQLGAAVVQLEHRYWGKSKPFETVNTSSTLEYLTVRNAIADFVNFAETVEFPFDPDCTSKASQVPWIFIGASYSGDLPAWTSATSPGTFWAYWASSAPVQAIDAFWQYQVPIERHMPQNCSTDLQLVAAHIDQVLTNGSAQEVTELKSLFGPANATNDEFLANTYIQFIAWQYADLDGDKFGGYSLCNNVENVFNATSPVPGAEGVGVEKALNGFAANLQSPQIAQALALQNGAGNLWYWLVCNEPFHWNQAAAPEDQPSLIPRVFTPDVSKRFVCEKNFPPDPVTGAPSYNKKNLTVEDTNKFTGGWFLNSNVTRTLYVSSEFDPYREATVSSDFRPGGPLQSTEGIKVSVVPGSAHGGDLDYGNALVNEAAKEVIDENVKQMVEWVHAFEKRA